MKQVEGSLRERVRCSSLVDWPVYPRLRRTMEAAALARNSDRGHRFDGASAYDVRPHAWASIFHASPCLENV